MIKKFDEFVQSLTESRMTKNDVKRNIKYAEDVIKEMLNCIKNKKETSDELKELSSDRKCLIISGKPGIGKTRIVYDVIKETGAEKSDYIIINSPKINLEEILSENKGKLIIFEDDVLKFNEENVVTFKRIVCDKEFNSFIVIVTNDLKSIADNKSNFDAIINRCSIADFEMDNEDAWEFIKDVLENQKEDKNLSDEERLLPLKGKTEDSDIDNVISYIDSLIKEKQVNISFREIVMIGRIVRTTDDWKEYVSKRLE